MGEFYCRIQGLIHVGPASTVAWGVRCVGTNFCDGGFTLHDVWVSIRSAIVTIDDPVDPLISEASGELAAGDVWQSGTRGVTFEGSDVTGIRQVGAFRGQTAVAVETAAGAASGGCGQLNQGIAYTFTKPCEGSRGLNGPQSLDVDTTKLPDGTNTLRLVVRDTSGNEAEDELGVKVDNSPPAAPVVTTGGGWSTVASARWVWSVPSEADRAPIGAVEVERCLATQGCAVESLPGSASSGDMAYEHHVPEGESTLRVRVTDSAGNVGAWSAASKAFRDRTAPTVGVEVPAGAQPGQAVEAQVTATDNYSGVDAREQEVRVGSGEWRVSRGAELFPEGSTVRFRARARDRVGNLSGWVESADVRVAMSPVLQATATPTAAPLPAASPTPRPTVKRSVRLTNMKARRRDGRLTISGRLSRREATGAVETRMGGRRVGTRVRNGRFVLRIRFRGSASAVVVRYRGDSSHLPASRRIQVLKRGG
jgi:hypothetical protein